MASFSRKLQSLSLSGRNKDDDNDKTERKSRSLFSGFGSSSSSSHSQQPSSSSSNRSPSPYAGRSLFREGSKSRKKHRHHHHDRNHSSSDVEYAGATSSANVSEAESDGEGRLSRLTSNSSLASTATGSSALPALASSTSSTSAATTPTTASTTSTPSTGNSVSFAEQQKSSAAPRPITQAGRGAPRNAFYDSGSDSDGEHDQRRRPVQQAPSIITAASAPASTSREPGLIARGSEPTSDSEDDEPSHEEYARSEGDEDSDDLLSGEEDMDPTVLANTEANAGSLTAAELLSSKPALLAGYGDDDPDAIYYDENGVQEDWPNLVKPTASPFATTPTAALRNTALATTASAGAGGTSTTAVGTGVPIGMTRNGRGRGGTMKSEIPLVASRPVYQRNRCTITLTHGDPDSYVQVPGNMSLLDKASKTGSASTASASKDPADITADAPASGGKNGTRKKRKGKTYVVASDLSEESYYAIEWAIGTVLRSGDELLFVTVMETDSKLDPDDGLSYDKTTKIRSQQERQTRAMQLSREATSLLERTRLHVRVKCQAIHAKNARHMLIDLIDYFAPTLVIIGSRGLSRLKGIILGSTSHYLIQKSSAPVMVTRRRLKPLRRPPRPISDLQRQPRVVGLANATIDVESHAGMVHQSHASSDGQTDGHADAHRLHDADTGGETET